MALFSIVGSFLTVVAVVSSQQQSVTMMDDRIHAKVRVKPAVGGQDGPENFEPGLYHPCGIDESNFVLMPNYTVSWEEAEQICELNGWALATPTTPDIFQHFIVILSMSDPRVSVNNYTGGRLYWRNGVRPTQGQLSVWLGGVNVKGTNNGQLQWLTSGEAVGDYFYANWTNRPASNVGMESQCTVIDTEPLNYESTSGDGIIFQAAGRHETCCQNKHGFMCRTGNPNITVNTDALKCPPSNPISSTVAPSNNISSTLAPSNNISSTEAPQACDADSSANLYPDYTESTFDGAIYTIVREPKLSWSEAKLACERQCSVLCEDVVHTSEEFQFLSKLTTCPQFAYTNTSAVWLGRNCNSTGTNDCPNISLDQNGLNNVISTDGICSEEHPFICKREQNLAIPVITTG